MSREVCNCKIVLEDGAKMPERKHFGDAGYDICASVDVTIPAHGVAMVPTGIKIQVNPDWYVEVVPRSGLAAKSGITVLNTPGTIDSNYRGIVNVIMYNTTENDYNVSAGDRIAQLKFTPFYAAEFENVLLLDESNRDANGFGSTGR